MKLCLIYNFAQHYRTNIFKLMSETFDCGFMNFYTSEFLREMGDLVILPKK